jgi:hypothetical protein
MVVPVDMWSESILDHAVTRAKDTNSYRKCLNFSGVTIGKGEISARIYDKILEIVTKSKKIWMFDIWGIDEVPKDRRIARVEFQLRREALKSFTINTIKDFFEHEENLWAHLTTEWLKFQSRPRTHHTQRKTLDWWIHAQGGYKGSQGAQPAVRKKAIGIDKQRLTLQTLGTLTSLHALQLEDEYADENKEALLVDSLRVLMNEISNSKDADYDFNEDVKRKRKKYHRVS